MQTYNRSARNKAKTIIEVFMKRLITILGLMSMSSTVLAVKCQSLDLEAARQKIMSMKGTFSDQRIAEHIRILETSKVAQLEQCAQVGQTISKEDGLLAIEQLVQSRNSTIEMLRNLIIQLDDGINDPKVSGALTSAFLDAREVAIKQIRFVAQQSELQIAKVRRLVFN